MSRRAVLALLCSTLILPLRTGAAQGATDYANPANWLCRPGRTDACAIDLTTSVIAAAGTVTVERFAAARTPAIDCFYVYPTVSTDTTGNSDLEVGPDERTVAAIQFARFAAVCRPFAPMYRQQTLTALRGMLGGRPIATDAEQAWADVRDAWRHYLAHDNGGRGVVLVGHSQGSRWLSRLIAEEIEGKPAQRRIVSALLAGWNLAVPAGRDVGGDFQQMPLCRSAAQTGCIVSWVTYRDTLPPPAVALFGRVPKAGHEAACVNPAALVGSAASLHAYLPARAGGSVLNAGTTPTWTSGAAPITSPFVSVPGLLSAECTRRDGAHYLALTVHGDPADPRTDAIGGDVVANGVVQRQWGLHLIDMQVVIGDLIELVRRQGAAYSRGKR